MSLRELLARGAQILTFLLAAISGFFGDIAPPADADARYSVVIVSIAFLCVLLTAAMQFRANQRPRQYRTYCLVATGLFAVATIVSGVLYSFNLEQLTFPYGSENLRAKYVAGTELTADARESLKDKPTLSKEALVRGMGGLNEREAVWTARSIQSAKLTLTWSYILFVLCFATTVFGLTEAFVLHFAHLLKISSVEIQEQQAGVAVSDGGLEKKIKARLQAFDFNVWRVKMAEIGSRVCRIEISGNAAGTGFLVGPDVLLTNYHVLKSVLTTPPGTPASEIGCRFDYMVLTDGSRTQGTVVLLHPTDWSIDYSSYSLAEMTRTPDNPPPNPDELDYALVRLARPIGLESLPSTAGSAVLRRGWIPVPTDPMAFVPKMALMIAQYPDGKPLKLAVDTESVIGVNASRNRVRYATNTEPGSSGSPVFDLEWKLVALHHLGDPACDHPPSYNQGVPIDAIRERLRRVGKEAALGGNPG